MSAEDRDAYVREVAAVAAPSGRLLLVEFIPGGSFGVPGIDPAEVERRFIRLDAAVVGKRAGNEPQRQGSRPVLPVCAGVVESGHGGQADLQRRVTRQLVDDGEGDRHVIDGQRLADKVFQFVLRRRRFSRGGFDHGERHLAESLVRHAHHAGVAHHGM